MFYVDGFVAAVPTRNKDAYIKMALEAATVFKDYGALKVVETWGDDVPERKVTSFPLAVKCEPDETVVFSWVIWTDRDARDYGMKCFLDDPRMKTDPNEFPFDVKRMMFGGFQAIVDQ